jgi:hypothetical protein
MGVELLPPPEPMASAFIETSLVMLPLLLPLLLLLPGAACTTAAGVKNDDCRFDVAIDFKNGAEVQGRRLRT